MTFFLSKGIFISNESATHPASFYIRLKRIQALRQELGRKERESDV